MIFRVAVRRLQTSVPPSSIYLSNSTSPYFNLSFEDWLFRCTPADTPILFMYRNDPSVIIGRNQNPWKETNQQSLQALSIPFVRRRSGGGTVYHDLGNSNFSIHLPRAEFDRNRGAVLVMQALHRIGISDARINERHDLCVGDFKMSSAYKIVNKRAYHHGTMLISTELKNLGHVLRNNKTGLVTKGVESVRSPVRNLKDFRSDVTHEAFVDAVVEQFAHAFDFPKSVVEVEESLLRDNAYITRGIEELQSWEWRYGQTPEFTHKLFRNLPQGQQIVEIHSKHGLVLSCSVKLEPSDNGGSTLLWQKLGDELVGQRYGLLEIVHLIGDSQEDQARRSLWQWLNKEM